MVPMIIVPRKYVHASMREVVPAIPREEAIFELINTQFESMGRVAAPTSPPRPARQVMKKYILLFQLLISCMRAAH